MYRIKYMGLLLSVLTVSALTACSNDSGVVKMPQGCSVIEEETASVSLGAQAAQVSGVSHWKTPHVSGELLVLKQTGVSAQGVNILAKLEKQQILGDIALVKTPKGQSDQAFAKQLESMGVVVQPNYIYQNLAVWPNDPGAPNNAGVSVGAGNAKLNQDYLKRILAPEAWQLLEDVGKVPEGAPIAILDSGVDRNHPELKSRNIEAISCIGDFTPTQAHGTRVTGVIAAESNNSAGIAGLTWSGSVLSAEIIGEAGGTTANMAKAVTYAVARGFKVINISAGRPIAGQEVDKVLSAALTNASKKAVIVVAAGNEQNKGIFFPAAHPEVIAVGAVGSQDGVMACYTATPTPELPRKTDIYAPGGAATCEGGDGIEGNLLLVAPDNSYTADAGTSFSAPQVSAVASLMRAANPKLSVKETKTLLLDSANVVNGLPHLDAKSAILFALP